jgi:chlorite dismutase
MQPAELNLATQVIGHGRFLFVRLPPGAADGELATALDTLGMDMENMHDVDGHPAAAAFQQGRFQLLRAEPALSAERDIPHPALLAATFLIRLEAASPDPLVHYEARLRTLIEQRAGTVETLVGVQRPRSYTSHAMTQYAYTRALSPRPGTQLPLGVVTPMNKTAAWWAMDWMRRESFFLPHYNEHGNITTKGHALVAEAGIPCITRRTVHHPEGYGGADGYDFVAYFEFADAHAPTFRAVMAGLRDTAQNPEWAYVREGPEWWGRRVRHAHDLWDAP